MDNQKEFDVKEDKKKRKKYRAMILYIILFIGIGYAFLQAALNITGTTGVAQNTWDVHFDTSSINYWGSTGTIELASLTADGTSITFAGEFQRPGDYVEGTVDVVNAGSIDAMVSNIEVLVNDSETIPPYLSYYLTYKNGNAVGLNHRLSANSRVTLRFRMEYSKNINPNQLPDTQQTLDFQLNISYIQANQNAIDVSFYSISSTPFVIGQPIPSGVTPYYTFDGATAAFGYPIAVNHFLGNDNNISESVVTFEYNNQVYSFSSNDSYEDALSMLSNIFDMEHDCILDQDDGGFCIIMEEGSKSSNVITIVFYSDAVDFCVFYGGTWQFNNNSLLLQDGYGCAIANQESLCDESAALSDHFS